VLKIGSEAVDDLVHEFTDLAQGDGADRSRAKSYVDLDLGIHLHLRIPPDRGELHSRDYRTILHALASSNLAPQDDPSVCIGGEMSIGHEIASEPAKRRMDDLVLVGI
jgi:hypothetical protein